MKSFDKKYRMIIEESDNNLYESREALRALAAAGLLAISPMAAEANPLKAKAPMSQSAVYNADQQANILARTIWSEARQDGEHGMLAVASVIHNRGKGNVNKMIEEIKKPRQFSCWNKMTSTDWAKFKTKEKSGKEWDIAKNIANEIVNKKFVPTINATHYYNPKAASPSWARYITGKLKGKLRPFVNIGSHKFLKIT